MAIAIDARLWCPVGAQPVLSAPCAPRGYGFRKHSQATHTIHDAHRAFTGACLRDPRRARSSLRVIHSQYRESAAVAEENTETQATDATEESNQVQAFLQWLAVQGPYSLPQPSL